MKNKESFKRIEKNIFLFLIFVLFVKVVSFFAIVHEIEDSFSKTMKKTAFESQARKSRKISKSKKDQINPENEIQIFQSQLINLIKKRNRFRKIDHSEIEKIVNLVIELSKENNLDPLLVISIIEAESNFIRSARSRKYAYGLCQIRYGIWKDFLRKKKIIRHRKDLFDIEKNLKSFFEIFNRYYELANSDIEKALLFYNCGPRNLKCIQSKKYSKKVLSIKKAYEEAFEKENFFEMAQL